jgi:MFS transporter, PPP family, 3-phenylpropionic acid transporter
MLPLPQVFLRFRAAQYLYWAMSSAFLGYWVVYFEGERRFPASEIGWMMSIYVSAAMAGQYVFGFASDRLRSIRAPVVGAALLFAAVAASMPMQTGTIGIRTTMALLGFLQQPIGPMLDSWTLKYLHHHAQPNRFGQIRSFGSLGWATIALLTAYLMLSVSWNMLFVVAVIAALLLSMVALTIPDFMETSSVESSGKTSLTMGRSLVDLFGNPAYRYILAVVFLMYLGVQTTFNFQGLLIKGTGGGLAELGWTFFFGVMSEMPAMFLSVWLLPRMSARRLMTIAGMLYMLRYGLIIYFQTSWIVMLTACLEGLAFGLLLSSLRSYVFSVVDEEVQTLAMTVVDATFLGLTVIVGGVVGGWLIEQFSIFHMVAACAISSGLALILLLAGGRWETSKPNV